MVNANLTARAFILPDLVSYCPFPVNYHPNGDAIADESDRWLDAGCPDLTDDKRRKLYGLRAGQLTAYCYPFCDNDRFRIICDFMNYLFHLDNVSDGMMKKETELLANVVMNVLWFPNANYATHREGMDRSGEEILAARLTRDFWTRCIQDAGPGVQARFCESMTKFFEAVNIEAQRREKRSVPDLKSYFDVCRDLSGCRLVFDLIEYGLGIDLPDSVVNHALVKALNDAANDLVTWSNDLYSYNVEQSRGDTHNMVSILMRHHGMDLQSAINYVGNLCFDTIDSFCENKANLPLWGPEIDRDLAGYVQGLEDWMVGNIHWSFLSERYFGKEGAKVKKTRFVRLLTKRVPRNAA